MIKIIPIIIDNKNNDNNDNKRGIANNYEKNVLCNVPNNIS